MIDLLTAASLGILQGVTEFLPISSSGHLVLVEQLLGLQVIELKSFDVVLHAGTLVALLFLFHQEWQSILRGLINTQAKAGRSLLAKLIVATLPAVIAGAFFSDWFDSFSRGAGAVMWIAIFFVLLGVLLFVAEYFQKPHPNKIEEPSEKIEVAVSWRQVILLGLVQAVALLPGVSRSGIVMATGMLTGLSRYTATRFAFLMLLPVAAAAASYIGFRVSTDGLPLPALAPTLIGFASSAVVSYFFAKYFLEFVKRFSLKIFAYYLVLVGFALLILL